MSERLCEWCGGPMRPGSRRDAVTCSTPCRQARHRFIRAVGRGVASGRALRLAYADPPYPGNSARYYGGHADFAGEVDHAVLLARLSAYDGWALSTSVDALPMVLALCPRGARVAAWHRGERPTRSARPLNAWEPVIYYGGRAVQSSCGPGRRIDSLVHVARARTTDPRRVVGAKPAVFARWVFDLLGAAPQDSFDDLFPGSGGVGRAWDVFAGVAMCGRDDTEAVASAGGPGAVALDVATGGAA